VIGPLVARWRAAGHPAPILLSLAEWRDSTDVFAIEYEDIREAHRLLAGRDPWPGVSVQRADVRRQLEQELMGKLVRLRQAYAALGGDRKRLAEALAGSVGGYLTMLRALLRLGGRAAPGEPAAVVRAAADLVGFPADAVADLIAQRRHPERLKLGERDPRASAYLAAVARTAEYVNRLT